MKPQPPEKSQFFDLLNRAVRTNDLTSRGNKRYDGCIGHYLLLRDNRQTGGSPKV